jgi:hypothetical protein
VNGIWEWVSDLSPLTFTSWGPNEPNNAKENCAHIGSGKSFNWNDNLCTEKFNFICEKDVVCIFSSVKSHIVTNPKPIPIFRSLRALRSIGELLSFWLKYKTKYI